MPKPNASLSLADLSAAGVRLRPYEVVTIVRELVLRLSRGELAGVPSPHVVRLSGTGDVLVEGPVVAGRDAITRAAQLLDALLPAADSEPQFRVPGGLRLVIGRALGTLDLPPFASLSEFADALARFGATQPAATIMGLVVAWEELVASRTADAVKADVVAAPPAQIQRFVPARNRDPRAPDAIEPLTISDIRRARRATGVRLEVIAVRSRIPLSLLRQLEWGYLKNWPTGRDGRAQLVQYAKATGLDEELVVAAVTPLLEELEQRELVALVPQSPHVAIQQVEAPPIEIEVTPLVRATGSSGYRNVTRSRRDALAVGALAIPALLAITLIPVWWSSPPASPEASTPPSAVARAEPAQPAAATAVAPGRVAAPAVSGTVQPAAVDRRQAPDRPLEPARPVAYRAISDGPTYSPAFASTGTAMFYQADKGGRMGLLRADADSRGAILQVTRIVDDAAENYHVRPSPDGSRIAFDSDRDGERGVYVADADGQNVRRVSPEGFAAVPSWSPDGSMLAFVRADARRPKVWNLWTLNLESGALREVTHRADGQPWGASWFPDGQRLAYSHEERLILHDLRTGAEQVFPTPRKGHLVRAPAVSPDGERIMFQVHRDGTWMLELSNGSMRRILEDPTAEEYTWSPDGKRVAFYSRKSDEWGVWVMAPR